jgi:hypothetical protein
VRGRRRKGPIPIARGAYVNVNKLTKEGECPKVTAVLTLLETDVYDYIFLADTIFNQTPALRSFPFFLLSSPAPAGRRRGGVVLLARQSFRNSVSLKRAGPDWIVVKAAHGRQRLVQEGKLDNLSRTCPASCPHFGGTVRRDRRGLVQR